MQIETDVHFSFASILKDRFFLFCVSVLITIDLLYPVTLTFDSGHYLMLSNIIKTGTWVNWDPFRGIVFPLLLRCLVLVMGSGINGLLLPLTCAHAVLFTIFTYLFFAMTQVGIHRKFKNAAIFLIFLNVGLDPLITGYFHTVLTEFTAALISAGSMLGFFELYRSFREDEHRNRSRIVTWTIYFLLVTPLMWNLKQPYIGAAYFPFLFFCLLLLVQKVNRPRMVYVGAVNVLILALCILSAAGWGQFLRSAGMPANPGREVNAVMGKSFSAKLTLLRETPIVFLKQSIKEYFAISNFYYFDQIQNLVISQPSLIRGSENDLIAYRMFNFPNALNSLIPPDRFQEFVHNYEAIYTPPGYINRTLKALEYKSNFVFTLSYLLLPFLMVGSLISWWRNRTVQNAFVFAAEGSVLINAVLNQQFLPIDRYIFWGYPILILLSTMLIMNIARRLGRFSA